MPLFSKKATIAASTLSFPLVTKDKVKDDERYAQWAANHRWTPRMERWYREQLEKLSYRPTIGVLMQCINPKEEFLQESLCSVFNQVYPFSELSIIDRGSTDPKIRKMLEKVEEDPRVKVLYQKGTDRDITLIAKIMKKTAAEYLLLFGAEDVLEPYSLFNMVAAMQEMREVDFVYSDSDLIDEQGLRFEPQFKPQWAVGAHYPLGYYQHPVLIHERVIVKMQGPERVSMYMENGELLDQASNHSKQAVQAPGVLYHARRRGLKNEVPPKPEYSVLMNENLMKLGDQIVIDSELRAMAEPRVPLRIAWWLDSLEREERAEMLFVMARYLEKTTRHKFTVLCSSEGALKKAYQQIATVEIVQTPADRLQRLHQEQRFDAAFLSIPDAGAMKLQLPQVWAPDFRNEVIPNTKTPSTIVFPTEHAVNQFGASNVTRLLTPCVDLDEIKLYKQKTSPILLREQMKIEKSSTVFSTFDGSTRKAFIDAALLLQQNNPDSPMDFFILGIRTEEDGDEIRKLITGSPAAKRFHLIYEGADRTAAYPNLWISNIFISTVEKAAYPLGILESMAFKKPVVSVQAPGVAEVMEEDNNGFLVEKGDIAALADKMQTLMKDIPLQDDFGRRSLEIIMEKFHVKKVATRLENLLRESIVT